jgi:hypothetical protein
MFEVTISWHGRGGVRTFEDVRSNGVKGTRTLTL